MKRRQKLAAQMLSTAIAAFAAFPALASFNYYTGVDLVGPATPHPIGDAARANWLTDPAVGTVTGLVDFEAPSFTASNSVWMSSLAIAPGVQLWEYSGWTNPNSFRVLDSSNESSQIGFNTTAGGDQRVCFDNNLWSSGIMHDFIFASPIQAFSCFLSGEGNGFAGGSMSGLSLQYTDSGGLIHSFATVQLPIHSQFVGFGDLGASITSVRLILTGPGPYRTSYSVDDVSWVGTVPEPASAGLLALSACGMWRRRWV